MTIMAFSTLVFYTDYVLIPFKEDVKALVGIPFIIPLVTFNEHFELSEKNLQSDLNPVDKAANKPTSLPHLHTSV